MSTSSSNESIEIREVWSYNLQQEFKTIADCVSSYPYVSIDTEFPGNVIPEQSKRINKTKVSYSCLRNNINATKLIQLGLTLGDEKGNLPKCGSNRSSCVWQFNFCDFNVKKDNYVKESIELLTRNGIDFKKNQANGILLVDFAELAMSSGIFMNNDVRLIYFHGSSDFGYLLKMLTGRKELPNTPQEFLKLMNVFTPNFYDVKHLAMFCQIFGGLDSMATQMNLTRVGIAHQAGSDSLLTYRLFMKFIEIFFGGNLPQVGSNVIYGVDIYY
ncbi:probable CCR4-associated factor 1 homolog 10 [Impatiens glandulifera]|uniref:probable CCR4-associated factor 1 homolog 10 n=1 Tax=Impatiens glandulifera TaxID=253017 RepID=UPI001FB0F8B5|nr:probable CCR4-associated factor 1 homolog 10 [Impatiens glandulifera]